MRKLLTTSVALSISLLSVTARAQGRCEDVFSDGFKPKISYYKESYPAFKEMSNFGAIHLVRLADARHELTQGEAVQIVKEWVEKTEAYFKAAGINFETVMSSVDISG